MKILRNELKNKLNIRTEKDFPEKGIEFIDITPLILQKETFEEITGRFVKELENKNIDYILAPEARGFIFGAAVANLINCRLCSNKEKRKITTNNSRSRSTI